MSMHSKTTTEEVVLRIYRGEPGSQYWEEFSFPYDEQANIISLLLMIRKNPHTSSGTIVTPVAWESGCLEEVCGSCSMLIDGVPRQACTALIRNLIKESRSHVIRLAPLTKFPLVRDLVVDRSRMFDNLKRIQGWVEIEGYHDQGEGPRVSQKTQELMYSLSACMTCGCCSESCPQVNDHSTFMGPAPIAQVRYFSLHPTGKEKSDERLQVMQEEGGISGCGNAQNCVRVCPKKIPLTDAIGTIGRMTTMKTLHDFFGV